MKDEDIVIVETITAHQLLLDGICMGGFKDKSRHGMLRLADMIVVKADGIFMRTKRWRPGNWSDNLYPTK
jgi:hypothetical protein